MITPAVAVVAAFMALVILFVVRSVVAADIHMQVIKIQTPQNHHFYLKCMTIKLAKLTFAGLRALQPRVIHMFATVPKPVAAASATAEFAGILEGAALAYRIACRCDGWRRGR